MTDCLEYEGNKFYFHIGERQAARELVLKYHYSGRCHENPTLVGSLHLEGGLYGDKGELVACCLFSQSNNNTWALKKVDLIVSNPPYVLEIEKQNMKANVLQYEPHLALFVADKDPLLFYNKIGNLAAESLNFGGKLFFLCVISCDCSLLA